MCGTLMHRDDSESQGPASFAKSLLTIAKCVKYINISPTLNNPPDTPSISGIFNFMVK
jgi:hypothetical protein